MLFAENYAMHVCGHVLHVVCGSGKTELCLACVVGMSGGHAIKFASVMRISVVDVFVCSQGFLVYSVSCLQSSLFRKLRVYRVSCSHSCLSSWFLN